MALTVTPDRYNGAMTATARYVPTAAQITLAMADGLITAQAAHILFVRYGMFGVGPFTLQQTVDHFGIVPNDRGWDARTVVRQIESKAMGALRSRYFTPEV